jgi:hypothetical protein
MTIQSHPPIETRCGSLGSNLFSQRNPAQFQSVKATDCAAVPSRHFDLLVFPPRNVLSYRNGPIGMINPEADPN